MSEVRFDGRVAIVTGAGGGLGRSHALLLASRGAKVVVNDLGGGRDGERQRRAARWPTRSSRRSRPRAAKRSPTAHGVDTADGGEAIVKTAIDAFGKVDIVIANAGILRDRAFHNMTEEDWDKIFAVHVKGSFNVIQPAFRIMRQNNYGRIIVTTSNAGLYGNFGQANYSAAKTAVLGFASTLELEGAKYNIKANVIAPVAASRLTEDVMPPAVLERLKPELVSPVVAYLCSEECEVSGNIFTAGGGYVGRAAIVERQGRRPRRASRSRPSATTSRRSRDMSGAEEFTNAFDEVSKRLMQATGGMARGEAPMTQTQRKALGPDAVGIELPATTFEYADRDVMLYALGIGATELHVRLRAQPQGDPDLRRDPRLPGADGPRARASRSTR